DEELRAGRVGVAAARHGEHALVVFAVVELGLDVPAGPTRAITAGAAALDHEPGQNAVKGQAVVEALLRELEKVFRMERGDVGPEFDGDVAFGRFELDAGVVGHGDPSV